MRAPLSRPLRCEPLEARDQPAGIVVASVAGGVLTLTGDDADNAVSLLQTGTTIEVTGQAGTTITGGPTFPNVTAIRAVLADGNDSLGIDATAAFSLPGAVTADLGDGNNFLTLATSAKLELGSLGVTAGDGFDVVFVAGGAGLGSKITGNVSVALGVGYNAQEPPYNDSTVTFQGLDLTGAGGLVVTALDGDETLTLNDVRVTKAVTANGGDGSFDVIAVGGTLGSVSLTSVGRQPSNPYDGTTLTATGTTVTGSVALKSRAGALLDWSDGATGPVTVTAGSGGYTTSTFHGTTTVTGNLTVKGFRNTLTADRLADLTVTGDVSVSAGYFSTLSTSEAILRARNISVSGTGGAEFSSYDSLEENTAHVAASGAMTIRGRTASFTQYGGQVTVGTKLSIVADRQADFYAATAYAFDAAKPKTTVTNGALLLQGRNANYYQMEGEVTTRTGLSVIAAEDAAFLAEERFQTEDPDNAGVYDSAAGAKTAVTAGKLLVQGGTSASYFQSEGDASFAGGAAVVSAGGSASFGADVGDGFDSVGPKTAAAGGLSVQGQSASFDQSGGLAAFAGGLSVVGRDGAQFRVETGETYDVNFDYFDVPADTTAAAGALTVRGGTGEVHIGFVGDESTVGKDVTIFGQGHHRIYFKADTGVTVGGKLSSTGAGGDHDWFVVGGDFSVTRDATIALGAGANFIDFGDDGGATTIGGNLSLTTGNGSDVYLLNALSVTGTTTITTGAGADRVSILGPTTFTGAVTVDLGGGADTLAVADEAGTAGPVTFTGASRVKFGAGNDTVRLGLAVAAGGDANSRVAFAGSGFLNLDGGLNLNTFATRPGSSTPATSRS
ncbi:MAG TPA: hypothetical protein VM597_20590 [Gemmataceae bacterium]|nr:hypothetical protein [Gemmataceae bacterium]